MFRAFLLCLVVLSGAYADVIPLPPVWINGTVESVTHVYGDDRWAYWTSSNRNQFDISGSDGFSLSGIAVSYRWYINDLWSCWVECGSVHVARNGLQDFDGFLRGVTLPRGTTAGQVVILNWNYEDYIDFALFAHRSETTFRREIIWETETGIEYFDYETATFVSTPEPTTLIYGAFGLIALVAGRRRLH